MAHKKLWKILKEMVILDRLTCLLRNLGTSQEATVRMGHRTMDWFQLGQEYVKAVYCYPAHLTYMQYCCSVAQSCLTLCDPVHPCDCSTPGLPVPHHLPEFAQVHVLCISDAIQSSHSLMPSFPFALDLSQHQGLFQ